MENMARRSDERIIKRRKLNDTCNSNDIGVTLVQTDDNMEELILELKFIVPNDQSKTRIVELWDRTFGDRQQRRATGNLGEYLKDFPVIGAFNGEFIKLEFAKIKPESKSFLDNWTNMQDKILKRYADMFVDLKNNFVRTLAIIRAKCPSRGTKRNKSNETNKKNPLSGVIEWIDADEDFTSDTNTPVLVCRGPFLEDSGDFALCYGSTLVTTQLNITASFEVLFYSFTVFGVEPMPHDKQFYSFVAGAICGITGMSTTGEKFLVSLD